jgi:hypothetical protein
VVGGGDEQGRLDQRDTVLFGRHQLAEPGYRIFGHLVLKV